MINWGWKPKDWLSLSIRERGLVIAGIDLHIADLEKQQKEIEAQSK